MAQLDVSEYTLQDQDPFGGKGKRVEIKDDRRIHVSQLAEEIEKKHGSEVHLVMTKDPATKKRALWIKPNDVDGRSINGALRSHQYDQDWGLTPEEVANKDRKRRLREGETLTLTEQAALLREIVEKENTDD